MQQEVKKKVWAGFWVMLLRDSKILLWRRHVDPEKASSEMNWAWTWTMPGGKLEFWESFEEGWIREVKEETWIELDNIKVICVNNDRIETAHFVTIWMLSQDFEGEAQVMEPDEITEWKWFTLENLPENVFPPSLKLLENYKENIFYISE
ncbi:MAG: MutT/nudix family protein [uncultured bacterium (gcode 4)]|uniref:MutT/nudix family protein n=1 Tax=uncultured bacterium (gcode 4) TaxID=1234023 RepID=K2G099_9BACT|nr:MAG: MutT/nudix family protein [uncultured bacterium (gcode 4)]